MKLTEEQQRLVTENSGLVGLVLVRYIHIRPSHEHWDDFYQDGLAILCKAAMKYDPSLGVKLSTYACRCLIHGLIRAMRAYVRRGVRGPIGYDVDVPVVRNAAMSAHNDRLDILKCVHDEDNTDREAMEQQFAEAFELLTERQRYILGRLRHGDTPRMIAADLGCTRQSVSIVKVRAVERRRRVMGVTA